jgi:hypothetical protein
MYIYCKMTSLYFEQCIHNSKIATKSLINLSQRQRAFNKTATIDNAESYYTNLKQLTKTLRYRRIPLKRHPQFEFDTHISTNWNFEMIRVACKYKNILIHESEKEEDLKEKNKLLSKAMHLSNDCSQMGASILFYKGDNKLFKFLNPQYHLSQTMKIASERFYNMYQYKPNYLAIKKAFQLREMSYLLWKQDEDILDIIRYKSKALLELANKLDDDDCGERLALLQKIVLKEGCSEDVKSQYEIWKQQNDSVYYQNVVTKKDVEVISLEAAFDILSKLFEIPLK